jgi:hypothetical protein
MPHAAQTSYKWRRNTNQTTDTIPAKKKRWHPFEISTSYMFRSQVACKRIAVQARRKFMSEQTTGCPWMAYMHHLPGSGRVFKSNRDAGRRIRRRRRRRRKRQIHDYNVVP